MSLVRYVKLRVPAGTAKPGPAIGQALGPLGINMAEFCKQFNDRTSEKYEPGVPLGVKLAALSDRTFEFEIKTPPTSYLIKRVLKMDKGPSVVPPQTSPVATITPEAVYEIAKIKQGDAMRHHIPLEGVARSVVGTCRSMGIAVREAGDEDDGEDEDGGSNSNSNSIGTVDEDSANDEPDGDAVAGRTAEVAN